MSVRGLSAPSRSERDGIIDIRLFCRRYPNQLRWLSRIPNKDFFNTVRIMLLIFSKMSLGYVLTSISGEVVPDLGSDTRLAASVDGLGSPSDDDGRRRTESVSSTTELSRRLSLRLRFGD